MRYRSTSALAIGGRLPGLIQRIPQYGPALGKLFRLDIAPVGHVRILDLVGNQQETDEQTDANRAAEELR